MNKSGFKRKRPEIICYLPILFATNLCLPRRLVWGLYSTVILLGLTQNCGRKMFHPFLVDRTPMDPRRLDSFQPGGTWFLLTWCKQQLAMRRERTIASIFERVKVVNKAIALVSCCAKMGFSLYVFMFLVDSQTMAFECCLLAVAFWGAAMSSVENREDTHKPWWCFHIRKKQKKNFWQQLCQ